VQTLADKKEWTDEALMALPRDGRKHELLGGELTVSPTGFQHGYLALRLATAMMSFALKHRLGLVVDSSTGFRMKNGDCLSPDVSFVRRERLRGQKDKIARFFQGAPDLVVEVISPGESQRQLRQKLAAYFSNGTQLAWVVNAKSRTAHVYTSPGKHIVLTSDDCLDGGTLLPGFSFSLNELFEIPEF
jgi:Uma2 family endonuclease